MFVGQPVFYYIDQSKDTDINANNRKLIGYIELTARCNSGSAFGNAISIEKVSTHLTGAYQLVNNGDERVFPSLIIKTPAAGSIPMPFKVEIKNQSNNTTFVLNNIVALDTVTLDMSIRTITSEKTVNIYGG
jgi:hypothetical protein